VTFGLNPSVNRLITGLPNTRVSIFLLSEAAPCRIIDQ